MMQKMIVVEKDYVSCVNEYLSLGYKVVSVTPIIKCISSNYDTAAYGAYVVIEIQDGDVNA